MMYIRISYFVCRVLFHYMQCTHIVAKLLRWTLSSIKSKKKYSMMCIRISAKFCLFLVLLFLLTNCYVSFSGVPNIKVLIIFLILFAKFCFTTCTTYTIANRANCRWLCYYQATFLVLKLLLLASSW